MDHQQPYDPYVGGNSQSTGTTKAAAIQSQIDETVNVMKDNMVRVQERGENLNDLQGKTDNLAVSAQGFRRGANRVRKKMWWKDMKMRILIIVGIIILLLIIILPIVFKTKN